MLIHDAAQALLLARYEDAAAAAEKAIAQNEDTLYLRWFYITALMRANKARRALDELDDFEQLIRDRDPSQIEYVEVMRAMLLQRLDRHDDAAKIYTSIFMVD
jgi:predicted Zn-dependent protease